MYLSPLAGLKLPERIRVLTEDGSGKLHESWADPSRAEQICQRFDGRVEVYARNGRVQCLRVRTTDAPAGPNAELLAGIERKKKYSHNHETDDRFISPHSPYTGVEKVWTLTRISRLDRPVFMAVVTDCITVAA